MTATFVPSGRKALYLDGALRQENSTSTPSSIFAGNAALWFGNFYTDSGSTFYNFPGDLGLQMLWSRALLDGEVAELNRNPYQIFVPRNVRFYSIPTATAPGVPTSLLNQNLAATSFRSAWTAPA
jgi:hypothetical protein